MTAKMETVLSEQKLVKMFSKRPSLGRGKRGKESIYTAVANADVYVSTEGLER